MVTLKSQPRKVLRHTREVLMRTVLTRKVLLLTFSLYWAIANPTSYLIQSYVHCTLPLRRSIRDNYELDFWCSGTFKTFRGANIFYSGQEKGKAGCCYFRMERQSNPRDLGNYKSWIVIYLNLDCYLLNCRWIFRLRRRFVSLAFRSM